MPWGRGEGGLGTSETVLCPYPCYELCHDRLTRGMCQLPSVLRAKAFCFINFNIVEAGKDNNINNHYQKGSRGG